MSLSSIFGSLHYRPVGVSVNDDEVSVALVVEVICTYVTVLA